MTHTTFPRAGFFRRLAAIIYDSLVITAVLMLATIVALGLVAGLVAAGVVQLAEGQDHAAVMQGSWLFSAYILVVTVLFYTTFWVKGGQTLGMRAWRLYLQNTDGKRISWRQALIRLLSSLFGLSNLGALLSKQKLGWHDRLAGCEVVVLTPEANQMRNWK